MFVRYNKKEKVRGALLARVVRALMRPYAGILAADERPSSMNKRFKSLDITPSVDRRREYRDLLVTTEGIESYVTGVILSEETFNQNMLSEIPFPNFLENLGIITGIKVDEGTVPTKDTSIEKVTLGLRNLPDRLEKFKKGGALFAKWRAVFHILGDEMPSNVVISKNTIDLAAYARMCIDAGIVPIVEPEVLSDGTHTAEKAGEVIEKVLRRLYLEIEKQDISFEHIILKTSMAIPGKNMQTKMDPEEVAEHTMNALCKTTPHDIGGVVFLSGGQSAFESRQNLNAIKIMANEIRAPFDLSYSFGRALQDDALRKWLGIGGKKEEAQQMFMRVLEKTARAREGISEE